MLSTETSPVILWNGQPVALSTAAPVDGVSLSTALMHIYQREGLEIGSITLTGSTPTNIEAMIVPTHPEACEDCRCCLSFLEIQGKLQRFLAEQGEDAFVKIVFRDGLPFVEPARGWHKHGVFDPPFDEGSVGEALTEPTSH